MAAFIPPWGVAEPHTLKRAGQFGPLGERAVARPHWTTIGNETIELCILPAGPRGVAPTIPAGPARAKAAPAERSAARKEPGNPLLSPASPATTDAGGAPTSPRADAARSALDTLLQRIERGESISERDAELAGESALQLGASSAAPAWLDAVFRLYAAIPAPLPAALLERLSEALTQVPLSNTSTLRAYLETLRSPPGGAWSEPQQQLIARLMELHSRCAPARG